MRWRLATAVWGGAAAGAVVGILFPPSILGMALVGGAIGGVSGHLWRGMSRAQVKELGDIIDAGQAALVIVGANTIQDAINKAGLKADKQIAKDLGITTKDLDEARARSSQRDRLAPFRRPGEELYFSHRRGPERFRLGQEDH